MTNEPSHVIIVMSLEEGSASTKLMRNQNLNSYFIWNSLCMSLEENVFFCLLGGLQGDPCCGLQGFDLVRISFQSLGDTLRLK